jgi:hypothetical protein
MKADNHLVHWRGFVVFLLLLSLLVSACGPEPTPLPTNTPPPPTDTPVPPTDTPLPTSTPTPTPTPTPEPLDPSGLVPPEDLDSYLFTEEILWEGTAPDGSEASLETATIIEYVREPMAMHLGVTSNQPEVIMALELMGTEGDTMDMYVIEDSIYMAVFGSWMQVSLDAPESMMDLGEMPFNPEDISFGGTYTMTQWLEQAEYEGEETYNGLEVVHYRFDETAFDLDLLPAGMDVLEASGNLYVTVEDGYLVHMDLTLDGTNLDLSTEAVEPTLAEGSLEYTADLSSINEPITVELPEEVVEATRLPEDIPLPDDATQWMAFDMMGIHAFIFASDSPAADVADFYRTEMPENGWTESQASEDAGAYAFTYVQEDRSIEVEIETDAELDKTLLYIVPGVEDTALQPVASVEAGIVADSFMLALQTADYAAAYDLCAPDLQAEFGSAEDLGVWMQEYGVEPLDWTFTSEDQVDDMYQFLGTALFAEDLEADLEVTLIWVDDEWLVAGFHVGGTQEEEVYATGNAFLTALKDEDYEQAYALFVPELHQQIGDVADLESMIQDNMAQPDEWEWTSFNTSTGEGGVQTASLEGSLAYLEGREGAVTLTLVKIGEEWKLTSFNLTW